MTNLMQISSMEKVLPKKECFSDEISEICVLQNECAAYQIAFKNEHKKKVFIKMESDIEDCIEAKSKSQFVTQKRDVRIVLKHFTRRFMNLTFKNKASH